MSDPNYWKDQYQHTWQQSASREDTVANLIETETGLKVETVGLGAGSSEYLAGSAVDQGYERGGADLHVLGTNVFIEVTGPLVKSVQADAPLWIRPDKIANARAHHSANEIWVVHHLPRDNMLRVIPLDEEFFRRLDRGEFPTVNPRIRGAVETYIAIEASSPVVYQFQELINRLNEE